MISGVSNSYSSYTRSSASTTASANSKKFQEELLAKLDTNGDGSIGKDELSSALSSNSNDGVVVSLSKAFSGLDSNDNSSLDATELSAMAQPPQPPAEPSTDVAEKVLSYLDSNGDGSVSSDELSTGLSSTDSSSADSSKVFSALDTNKDGTISLDELTASLQPAPSPPPAEQDSSTTGSSTSTSTSTSDASTLFSNLDADSSGSVSLDELTSALSTDITGQSASAKTAAAEALSKMVAALSQRYETDGSKPIGNHLNVAA